MEPSEKKSSPVEQNHESRPARRIMRALHRDVGFFVVGLVLVYSLSGIVLVYRDIGLLTYTAKVEKELSPGMAPDELGKALHLRGFKVLKTEGDVVFFPDGSYNKATGLAAYSVRQLPTPLQKFVELHKIASAKLTHWYAIVFGVLLSFLGISSFWMYNPGSPTLRRGIYIAGAGIVVTAVVMFL